MENTHVNIYLLRHGQTAGNIEHRYIGRTDEPLCAAGTAALRSLHLPPVTRVYASPLRRCTESARLLWNDAPITTLDDLRECDFGAFEGKNYAELNGNPDYQRWIDSGGELPFPGGESRAEFTERCCAAFERALHGADWTKDVGFAVHGGTIMAIMERFAWPRRGYFDWQVGNGAGYALFADEDAWAARKLPCLRRL